LEDKKINCLLCKHYYVTWDPQFPKGCRAYQFKSNRLPSVEVLRASGEICLKFESKN